MTISILLPTRDRLDYLKLAIDTVRRQDCADWEIVISDNHSSENIADYVTSLEEKRIRYARTEKFLPVTENWNRALAMSSGEYVVMMGDDDALLPGYLTHMQQLLERFDQPDLVYVGALLFSYPGVDPDYPRGFLAANCYAEFFGEASEPFVLAPEHAVTAVRRSMAFRHVFNFNMQLSLLSRGLIEEVRRQGDFFQSPFPDFYATCAALLCAKRVVADPGARVVIGVTPKSYGFFHLNEREREGRAFLSAERDEPQLPGTNINEGWLGAMESLENNYGREFGVHVSRRRYRLVQAVNVYTRDRRGLAKDSELAELQASLTPVERFLFGAANQIARPMRRLLPSRLWNFITHRTIRQSPIWDPEREEGRYANVLEVYESRPAAAGRH